MGHNRATCFASATELYLLTDYNWVKNEIKTSESDSKKHIELFVTLSTEFKIGDSVYHLNACCVL